MRVKQTRREISIGELRNAIYLMEPEQDTGFNTRITYPEELQILDFCKVIPGSGTRQLQEANVAFDDVITFYIRYRRGVSVTWRFKYNDLIWTPHYITNMDGVNRFFEILAYTKVS